MKSRSLKFRMIVVGVSLVVVPLIVLMIVSMNQGNKISDLVRTTLVDTGYHEMDSQLELIYDNIKIAENLLNRDVQKVIETGSLLLENKGGIRMDLAEDSMTWSATNQFTGQTDSITLPGVAFGDGTIVRPEKSFNTRVPLVDEIMDLTGDTATIFQRMNGEGDMLRIATNVDKGGQRAVGTYIPATNPDGSANPVIKEVLSGRDFVGRAYVVDQWYVTVYRPLRNSIGEITGILYVGAPEAVATDSLLDLLAQVKVGKTGYIYILNTKGNDAGRYVLSGGRSRDGEIILDATDSDGRLFIREMVEKAPSLRTMEIGEIRYPWKNAGDREARDKVVRYIYFSNWDWVVAIGSYEEEIYEKAFDVQAILRTMILTIIAISVIAGIVAAVMFTGMTGSVVKPIERIIESLHSGSLETTHAAQGVSSASQHLAEGANDQAASLEEAHASMETMNSLVDRNNEVAKETRVETAQSNDNARRGVESMHSLLKSIQDSSAAVQSMGEVIAQIKESSNAVSKIIDTIDNIAFQTNILALNASVEAARAGEAGAGFAVVAEEVSNLAGRAASAARETASMIGESVQRSEKGVTASDEVSNYLAQVEEGSRKANELLEGIAESIQRINSSMEIIESNSMEQNSGIGQLTEVVGHINNITQQNAASAEETASASEELNAQAVTLQEIVTDLAGIIHGKNSSKQAATDIALS